MIGLIQNQATYENDIRALLMAFFPGEKIVMERQEGWTLRIFFHSEEVGSSVSAGVESPPPYQSAGLIALEKQGETIAETQFHYASEDYRASKNLVKRRIYDILSQATAKELPWGTLTGIRPAKIVTQLLMEGQTREEIRAYLKEEYKISDQKFDLCLMVAENEHRILSDLNYEDSYSLYVGIPFCPTICAYCSFSSFPLNVWHKKVDDYLAVLFKELDYMKSLNISQPLLTLYMGGGTPTSLTAEQMDRLLKKLSDIYDFSAIREITIEAGRPDSITSDKLKVIKSYEIDRISINPQSMKQATLDLIGRRHTVEQTAEAFAMARAEGFRNINMDLIAGLPGETLEDMAQTLDAIQNLGPDSLTVHSLALKRAAYLNQNADEFEHTTQATVNQMINMSFERAKQMGMAPYYLYRQKNIAGNLENVGYAKPGKEGLYNILIMEEKQTIAGVGAGASTKVVYPPENRIERTENVKNVKDYMERIDEMLLRKKNLQA